MDLRWTAHPAKRRPRDVALVAAVVLLSSWAVMVSLRSFFLAGLAAVILLVSVAAFLAPTHYALTDDGVELRRLGRRSFRPWAELRRAQIGPGAALLSPFARPHRLDRYRGLMVFFDGADRAQVIAAVRTRLPEQAA
ncbi:MAG: hypothetical protein K8W52_31425 [Deltaproteobacteria bacterium]|nr:hypothetical protein [Deltaproteobacteria bacterium]